jgi:tetratricopeptide (TPR) repeat protein
VSADFRHSASPKDQSDRLRHAEALRERHGLDPNGVLAAASSLVAAAGRDVELRVVARHAAALAHTERLDLPAATRQARLALSAAVKAGLERRAAEVRLTLAWLDLDRGRAVASMEHLDAALPLLRGRSAARARCMRGLNLCATGQLSAAISELTAALPGLRRHRDTRWVANALIGRGIAYAYTDALRAADADFAKAAQLWASLGQHDRAGGATNNRGFVAVRAGDVPRGLELFAEAAEAGFDVRTRPEALIDRGEAMLAAGLLNDARPVLDAAVKACAEAGRGTKLAEATLVAAYCAVRQRDLPAARAGAEQAARLFRRQGRPWWVPLASALQVHARWLAGERTAALQRAAERAAADCERHGWRLEASRSVLTAARVALGRGAVPKARELLGDASALRRRGTADVRVSAWYAEALLRQADGDRRGVLTACGAGLRVVDEHAALLGSAELQAHATGLARDLAELATGVALADGDAKAVLRWTERWRAGALARPAVRPPADPVLAAELVALRSAVAAARDAVESGRPDPAAERRVARLEQSVRRRALAAGNGHAAAASAVRREPLDLAALRAALGQTALLSLVVHDGRLQAVSVVEQRCTLHDLGPVEPLYAEVDALRFGLHRLARGASSGRIAAAVQASVDASSSTLDKALLGPVLPEVGERPLVVVPTGPLHALPWAGLPSCTGRPVTVAPSVLCWLRAARALASPAEAGSAWVAGPRLEHAVPEVTALHAGSGGGRLLVDGASTVDAVLAAMESSAVAHIAAHGRFRSDQPLFSALEMADGPLYVHDLDRLRRGPRLLVLSACEAGLSGVHPGDELMGLVAALLARGTATLIASVVPVPDERTAGVMTALHAGLRSGQSPAAALAVAQAEHGQLGFACFGAS